MLKLGPDTAHIFRITHLENVPWILRHGVHCQTSHIIDPNFVSIGLPELIKKRNTHTVPIPPGGLLGDYVPFYFTPSSVMMFNIKTGRNGVSKRANGEIAVLVSSLHHLVKKSVPFVFTNGHAYMKESNYFNDLGDLGEIDWDLLRRKDFKHDPEDPGKLGRYQAEALVHRHVPVQALLGIACYHSDSQGSIRDEVERLGLVLSVKVLPEWYF